jgi:hypothetical protein
MQHRMDDGPQAERDTSWMENANMTVSDKIRVLDREGYTRAEISRLLNKRYQHIRNVLEGDKVRGGDSAPLKSITAKAEAVDEVRPPSGGVFRLRIEADGRVLLPGAALRALRLRPGDALVGRLGVEGLNLTDVVTSARLARTRAREVLSMEGGLSDSLLADRRQEAMREIDG